MAEVQIIVVAPGGVMYPGADLHLRPGRILTVDDAEPPWAELLDPMIRAGLVDELAAVAARDPNLDEMLVLRGRDVALRPCEGCDGDPELLVLHAREHCGHCSHRINLMVAWGALRDADGDEDAAFEQCWAFVQAFNPAAADEDLTRRWLTVTAAAWRAEPGGNFREFEAAHPDLAAKRLKQNPRT